jgi:hypothetical protein
MYSTDRVDEPVLATAPATATARGPFAPSPVNPDKKSVQFDLQPQEKSPDAERREEGRGRHARRDREAGKRRRDGSADSNDSDATIDLPDRFDSSGRRKADDPAADKLEQMLSGLLFR